MRNGAMLAALLLSSGCAVFNGSDRHADADVAEHPHSTPTIPQADEGEKLLMFDGRYVLLKATSDGVGAKELFMGSEALPPRHTVTSKRQCCLFSLSPTWRNSSQGHVDELLENVGMLHERGVPIVLGTDTGTLFSFAGYSVHDELEYLVKAGLAPEEALAAATRRAAEMLDAEDEFGTVEPGKRADLLILGANPLDDIRNTRSLDTVIAEGRLVNRDALPIRIP